MSSFAKVAIAVIAVIAVGTVGVIALRPGGTGTVGSAATPIPTSTPAATPAPTPTPASTPTPPPSPTVAPTAAPSVAPPLTGTFTSPIHGISLAYPAGWTTRSATEPWTVDPLPVFSDSNLDVLYGPELEDHLFFGLASQPLAGRAGDQWAADFVSGADCGPAEPVTIDGAAAFLGEGQCIIAAVATGGRGYFVWLHRSPDEPWLVQVYDRSWFEQVLATVDLRPEDAVDPAS